MRKFISQLVEIFKNDGVGILPTDTIYGLVGPAFSKKAVARIYKLRSRSLKKPMIILIGSLEDLNLFRIRPDEKTKELLNKFWPGRISVILSCPLKKFSYLHRGTKTLAFRLPNSRDLKALLKKSGPLVAPSANPEGLEQAATIRKAKSYFGDYVDFYVDKGRLASAPSTLIAIKNGRVSVKRKGAVEIESKRKTKR